MLNKISNKFYSWSKGWLVLVLMVLDMFFMGFIMPLTGAMMKDGTGLQQPLDLMFFSTPAQTFAMIESYGDFGRPFYRNVELTVGILYPIIYTLAFGLLISWLFQRGFKPGSTMMKWNVMPVGMWLFALLENLGIVTMLSMWPAQPVMIAWLTMIFTTVKWLFVAATLLLVIFGLVMAVKNGFKKQKPM
jgi:hypothetical protein